MIQANELRHNNYYILNGKIDKYNILSYGQWNLNCYSPIPLTPEILEKCGFKIYAKYKFWVFVLPNKWYISMWMEDNQCAGFEEKFVCYWGDNFLPVRCLHQLQNLYFALTGEELNYQPHMKL